MHINMFWPNPTHASDNINCFSTWVYQSSPMPARTQNSSQHVLTKPIPCHRGHKMHLNRCWPNLTHVSEGKKNYFNLCWPNLSHESEDIKCISTWVYQTHPLPARTQIYSQHVLNIRIPSQREHKMYRIMGAPIPSHDIEDSKCNTCVTKPLPSQRGQNMQFNMCWRILSHGSDVTKCTLTCL